MHIRERKKLDGHAADNGSEHVASRNIQILEKTTARDAVDNEHGDLRLLGLCHTSLVQQHSQRNEGRGNTGTDGCGLRHVLDVCTLAHEYGGNFLGYFSNGYVLPFIIL